MYTQDNHRSLGCLIEQKNFETKASACNSWISIIYEQFISFIAKL